MGSKTVLYPSFHAAGTYGDFGIRRLRPNASFKHRSIDGVCQFDINSRGMRSTRDFDYDKPDGTTRVFCLGDSHTQGFERRQHRTYTEIIGAFLEECQSRAESLNAGVSGFSKAEA